MAQAARDENAVTTLLGSFNGTPTLLMVENATGYLKAAITNSSFSAPSVSPSVAAHDDNNVASALGSFNGVPKPLMVRNSDGSLRAVLS